MHCISLFQVGSNFWTDHRVRFGISFQNPNEEMRPGKLTNSEWKQVGCQFQPHWKTQNTWMLFLKVKMNLSWNHRKDMERWRNNPPTTLGIIQTLIRGLLVPSLQFSSSCPPSQREIGNCQLPKRNQKRPGGKTDLPSSGLWPNHLECTQLLLIYHPLYWWGRWLAKCHHFAK